MDNPQQLARTGALAAWVNAALGLVLILLIFVADESVPVALLPAPPKTWLNKEGTRKKEVAS